MAQLLIAEMAAKRAGEALCGELLVRGLKPTALDVIDGGGDVLIVLTIIDGQGGTDWAKGFLIDSRKLSPDVVETELEKWKAKVRTDLERGSPTRPVQQAIERWGRMAVDRALAAKYGHA